MSKPVNGVNGPVPDSTPNGIDTTNLEEIPEPPKHYFGLLGHIPDIDTGFPLRTFWTMMELYGPIYKVNVDIPRIFVGNQELANEIYDQDRFKKVPKGPLVEVRALTGDGLFTAYLEEPNWAKAHRLLIPAFGPLGLRKMFDGMLDISSQMVLKWDRQGPDHEIDCSDDLTRLAFDTIGLCAFSYRFNEFYSEHVHPFATQMAEVLLESGKKANRPKLQQYFYSKSEEMRQENVRKMHELCDMVISDRKEHPQPENNDLLNTMLNGIDKETEEKLSDENIRYQMATLLVAGHETTSATLSFVYYNLIMNPEKLHKAQQQVDEIVGDSVITVDMLPKLTYIDAVIKETLRLSNPIGVTNLDAITDEVLGGKYFVPKGTTIAVLLKYLHRDRKVWGDDVDEFRPERMLDGGFQALPPNSWKPFGNGLRACIGRGFAEQEMILNISLVLQRFSLEMADSSYDLQLKSTLTIKPANFKMTVRRRPGKSLLVGIPGGVPSQTAEKHKEQHERAYRPKAGGDGGKQVNVFFGGETGTCESLAQTLSEKASDYGIRFDIQNLDSATENLSTDRPNIIITSSYEGKAPYNAKGFVSWLEQLSAKSRTLPKIKYAVYGVGNSDWAATFHRIPRLVDETIGKLGGERLIDAGYSDVKGDLVGPWEDWSEALCGILSDGKRVTESSTGVQVSIESSDLPRTLGGEEMNVGTIIANRELADTAIGPAKRHIDVRLPEGSSYAAGDYLVIQPRNPEDTVHRVLARFALSETDIMSVKSTRKKFLPQKPTSVQEFLFSSVELATPVTKRQVATIAEFAKEGSQARKDLNEFQEDSKYQELLAKRYSILGLLEDYPKLDLPFGTYIDMLQALTPRQYSISSSPLEPSNNPGNNEYADIASLTFDVQESPETSGHGIFHGVASSYLANRRPGDRISCFVRPTSVGFRMPADTETPLIMIAAGTGIAPMRAFLQERAAIKRAGVRKLGPAMLFFGCRNENKDFIYRKELEDWERQGIVEIKSAFSRPDHGDKMYVNEVLEANKDRVSELFESGGKIFLCGSAARLAKSTAESCKKIYRAKSGKSQEEADEWLERVKVDRYISDVY